jgi:hypothetical protein
VVVSLLAYFFVMITALSAIAALLIGSFNNSATESVLHYSRPQRPIIEQTLTTTNSQPRDLPGAPRIKKEEVPVKKDEPKKNINDSRVLFAKADTAKRKLEIKNKPERLAHLNKFKGFASQREKPKVLARQRNIYERPGYYGNTMGYAQETQYGSQRPFYNWWLSTFWGADMTPETDENGSDPGAPRNTPAPLSRPAARGRNDALWAGFGTTVVPVALGLMLGIGYLGYANVQRQIKAQHAELETLRDTQHAEFESLKDKNHGRTDVDQSQPSTSEIQGLQNHVETLRGQAKRQKK